MPIYEYECKSCHHRLEAIQGFEEAPLVDCPTCHKPELAKLLSAPTFQLKETGWYVTDFKNNNGKNENKSNDGASCGAGECQSSIKKADSPSNT